MIKTILENVINDETTDPGIVSNLVDLKQETENAPISETCGNNVDDNVDGMIATVSDEGCAPTSTTNAIITDTTNSDTNANTTDTTNSDTNANTTDTNTNTNTNTNTTDTNENSIVNTTETNTNTTTSPPASETCDIGADNSTDGTIASTSNEGCTPYYGTGL